MLNRTEAKALNTALVFQSWWDTTTLNLLTIALSRQHYSVIGDINL